MSILSQKTDIFQKIAVLKTANELNSNENNINQIPFSPFESSFTKNQNDPFLFVIDLLKIVSGSDSVKTIINQVFSNLNSLEIAYKNKLQSEFAASLGGSKNTAPLPNSIQSGSQIHINKIDYFGDLLSTPANTLNTDAFSTSLKNSIQNPGVSTSINPSLNAVYNNSTGIFTFSPTIQGGSFANFTNTVINNTKFIDTPVLLSSSLDILFNTTNKTNDQLTLEQQMDIILNKFITQTDQDDTYFTFDTEDINDIQSSVIQGSSLSTNVGTSVITSQLTAQQISGITSAITYPVSKTVISNTIDSVSNLLINNSNTPNSNTIQSNDMQSVANNFQSSLLSALKANIIRKLMLSPQFNIIFNVISMNPVDNTFDPIADLQARKNLIKCMMNQIVNDIIEGIYSLLKKEILSIVSSVALIYVEEAFDKYKKILTSLI